MLQIPRYILTLHELLAHTPHEHVERNSLDYAKSKLEELSRSALLGGAVPGALGLGRGRQWGRGSMSWRHPGLGAWCFQQAEK